MIRLGIVGPNGRMGKALIDAINKTPSTKLNLAIFTNKNIPNNIEKELLVDYNNLIKSQSLFLSKIDVLIDFSNPISSLSYLDLCVAHKINLVLGTTGFNEKQKLYIDECSKKIAIVFSPNFSIAMNLLFYLVDITTKIIGNDYDTEIIEAHHRYKNDAPSGTALKIGEIIANAKNINFKNNSVFSREGLIGQRKKDTIGFSTIRAGDIVGDHTALFANDGERLEITHKASNRLAFALGAIESAIWLINNNHYSGLFNMNDVLNLHKV